MMFRAVALFALLLPTVAQAQSRIPWARDFQEAAELAARDRKLVLLHFYSDNCPPCQRVEALVFPRQEVGDAVSLSFVPVRIDVEKMPEMARRYQVSKWPTDVIVTSSGLEVFRTVSPQDPQKYIAMLNESAAKAGSLLAKNQGSVPTSTNQRPAGGSQYDSNGYVPPGTSSAAPSSNEYVPNLGDGYSPRQALEQRDAYAAPQNQYGGDLSSTPAQSAPTQPRYADDARHIESTPPAMQSLPQHQPGAPHAAPSPAAGFRGPTNEWLPQANKNAVQTNPYAQQASPAQYTPPAQQLAANAPRQPTPVNTPIGSPEPSRGVTPQPTVSQPPVSQPNVPRVEAPAGQPSIGLEGYCTVTLAEQGKWKRGDKQFGAVHRGRIYLFVSAEEQKKFLADPDRFSPALSGYDPVQFVEGGKLVDGNRKHGLTYNSQVYLFGDEESLKRFQASPRTYAETVYQALLRGDGASKYR